MKIVGITRIRNESNIILTTLDHVSNFVDEIYIYDDCSIDNTVELCKSHKAVKFVIEGNVWGTTARERRQAEGTLRDSIYRKALESKPDYVYYFDADEYVFPENIDYTHQSYTFRLFDFYITPTDIDKHFLEREMMGPEYRDIIMMFKPNEKLRFNNRQPIGFERPIGFGGYVKHYGKAISVEEWESTCQYYINNRGGKFKERWEKRCGKAIHTKSSFNNDFITWKDRKTKGLRLNQNIAKNQIY